MYTRDTARVIRNAHTTPHAKLQSPVRQEIGAGRDDDGTGDGSNEDDTRRIEMIDGTGDGDEDGARTSAPNAVDAPGRMIAASLE